MRIDAISIGKNPPEEVNVLIEVAIGGEPIKYEMDKEAGTLFVDRFLYTPMRYPGNYGFIPHTLSEDGDPCDVLVANTRPLVPGSYIAVRPIGVMLMEDEGGGDDPVDLDVDARGLGVEAEQRPLDPAHARPVVSSACGASRPDGAQDATGCRHPR